jgi:hypothetical protein
VLAEARAEAEQMVSVARRQAGEITTAARSRVARPAECTWCTLLRRRRDGSRRPVASRCRLRRPVRTKLFGCSTQR